MADYDEWLFIQVSETIRFNISTVKERRVRIVRPLVEPGRGFDPCLCSLGGIPALLGGIPAVVC